MRYIFFICVLVLTACSKMDVSLTPNTSLVEGTNVSVTIAPVNVADPSGKWRAQFVFETPQNIMFFSRSKDNYREASWVSEDENARFENVNGFDAMIFDHPSAETQFVFEPYSKNIFGDYTPFIKFSDGGIAVFTGQFEVMPVKDREVLETLEGKIERWNGDQPTLGVRVLYNGTMIQDGQIIKDEVVDVLKGGGDYIYVGDAKITEGLDFVGVIDSGLPQWVSSRFDADLNKIYNAHRALWGEGLAKKSTVLFAFKGYEGKGFSNSGGALNNMLALEVSGQDLLNENAKALSNLHWFFAHEVAHLFQSRKNSHGGHPWMHEGSANAMAIHVLREQDLVDEDYIMSEYAKEYSQCVHYLKEKRFTYYQCGDLIAQMTDGALPNISLFEFWNELIDVSNEESEFTQEDYFKLMLKHGADEVLVEGFKTFIGADIENPAAFLADLMTRANLEPKFDADQNLISLKLP